LEHSLRNIRFRKHIYDWLAFAADDRPDFFFRLPSRKNVCLIHCQKPMDLVVPNIWPRIISRSSAPLDDSISSALGAPAKNCLRRGR
jgi:hypothetical protein